MTNDKEFLKNLRDQTQKQLDNGNCPNERIKQDLEDQRDFLDRRIEYGTVTDKFDGIAEIGEDEDDL